ncbi:MAG: PepSY domain-containing protein [Rhodocyclaceae bacterium]|jgi:uncharacterized membrane protein YkoI|nr:PepSY domain-containing protein [Rhodocyclaceae bacterium]MCL4759199.1 PepSY domain-containing protein [Rhodocyclaceae bacterium]
MTNWLIGTVLACLLVTIAPSALAVDRERAAAIAQQETRGRVLGVTESERRGDPVFLVRVLTPSGEVRVIVVDARTGAVRR